MISVELLLLTCSHACICMYTHITYVDGNSALTEVSVMSQQYLVDTITESKISLANGSNKIYYKFMLKAVSSYPSNTIGKRI